MAIYNSEDLNVSDCNVIKLIMIQLKKGLHPIEESDQPFCC